MKIQLSQKKIDDLKAQVELLKKTRDSQQEEQVKRGGPMDSWHEAGAYAATQDAIKEKVRELTDILSSVKILPEEIHSNIVILGCWVTLKGDSNDLLNFRIVHSIEADPNKSLISIDSPLGKLLHNRKVGEKISFNDKSYKITKIC